MISTTEISHEILGVLYDKMLKRYGKMKMELDEHSLEYTESMQKNKFVLPPGEVTTLIANVVELNTKLSSLATELEYDVFSDPIDALDALIDSTFKFGGIQGYKYLRLLWNKCMSFSDYSAYRIMMRSPRDNISIGKIPDTYIPIVCLESVYRYKASTFSDIVYAKLDSKLTLGKEVQNSMNVLHLLDNQALLELANDQITPNFLKVLAFIQLFFENSEMAAEHKDLLKNMVVTGYDTWFYDSLISSLREFF